MSISLHAAKPGLSKLSTTRQQVGRNAALNTASIILPAFAAVFAMPILISNLGVERVGLLTLAFGFIGFSGIFDLGLGRALTQSVAYENARGTEISALARLLRGTALTTLLLGLLWAAIFYSAAILAGDSLLQLSQTARSESTQAIFWLSLTIPLLLVSSAMSGAMEGLQLFLRITAIRVPTGVFSTILPALMTYFVADMVAVMATMFFVRLISAIALTWSAQSVFGFFRTKTYTAPSTLARKDLWRFSGWLSVSNIISPLMVQADRYFLASMFPPGQIAYYTVPLDMLLRGINVPVSAVNAFFPALATNRKHPEKSNHLLRDMLLLVTGFWGIPILLGSFLLEALITLWLGEGFAKNSLELAHWLLLGMCVAGFSQIPYAMIQSVGRSDLTAKLHLVEFPVYICLLVFFVSAFGLLGAAIAWTVRITIDAFLLFVVSSYLFPASKMLLLTCILSVSIISVIYAGIWFG